MSICTFCFQGSNNPKPWCSENPGEGCTYGMHHEFPGSEFAPAKQKERKPQVKKVDKQVCTKCQVHAKNPTSQTNGCEHEYPQ